MKDKRRPTLPQAVSEARRQAPGSRQGSGSGGRDAEADAEARGVRVSANLGFSADAMLVPATMTKHGTPRRDWHQIQFAIAALQRRYPAGAPIGIARKTLYEQVNEDVATDPAWRDAGFPPISLKTIVRAMPIITNIKKTGRPKAP